MAVILEMAWIRAEDKTLELTQLTAMRVDDAWRELDRFEAVVCPAGLAQCEPDCMALNGYPLEAFQTGEAEADAVRRLVAWLRPDDWLVVWYREQYRGLAALWRKQLGEELPYPVVRTQTRVLARLRKKKRKGAGILYNVAEAQGLPVPAAPNCTREDVALMRAVYERLGLTPEALSQVQTAPQPKESVPRRERNRAIIDSTQFLYIYSPGSDVFHTRACPRMLSARMIQGCGYYITAVKKRRPCKICKPEPDEHSLEKMRQTESWLSARQKRQKAEPDPKVAYYRERIKVRVIGDEIMEVPRGYIVGYCRNSIHPGHLTKSLVKRHGCIGKQCIDLQRYDVPYWAAYEQQQQAKARMKQQRKDEKARLAAVEEAMGRMRAAFQTYADETESGMDVIRVECPEPDVYTVFYVSDNRFADGDRFPALLAMIRQQHPGSRVVLRHIMDLDDHFMTREEYRALRRS